MVVPVAVLTCYKSLIFEMLLGIKGIITRDGRDEYLLESVLQGLFYDLIGFGKEAATRAEKKTVEGYLRALLPFFTYLETDEWQVRAAQNWKSAFNWSLSCFSENHRIGAFLSHPLVKENANLPAKERCAVLLSLPVSAFQTIPTRIEHVLVASSPPYWPSPPEWPFWSLVRGLDGQWHRMDEALVKPRWYGCFRSPHFLRLNVVI